MTRVVVNRSKVRQRIVHVVPIDMIDFVRTNTPAHMTDHAVAGQHFES